MNKKIEYLLRLKEKVNSYKDLNFYYEDKEVREFKNNLSLLESFIIKFFSNKMIDKKKLLIELESFTFLPSYYKKDDTFSKSMKVFPINEVRYCQRTFNNQKENVVSLIEKIIDKIEFYDLFDETIESNNDEVSCDFDSRSYSNPINITGSGNTVVVNNGDNNKSIFRNMRDELDKAVIDETLREQLKEILFDIEKSAGDQDKSKLRDKSKKFIQVAGSSASSVLGIVNGIIDLVSK